MAKFISKYLQLKLINKASYSKEVEGRVVVVPGKSVQFNNGVYETTDKDEISFLKNHPNFGNIFIEVKEKDVEKAQKNFNKTLEDKETEKANAKAKKETEKKALKEGEEAEDTTKGKGQKAKKDEKPKF